MGLFDPTSHRLVTRELAPPRHEVDLRLRLLRDLIRRFDDSSLWVESRVEQSFNERLFSELFDYKTLFRDGAGAYNLEPKGYLPGSGRYHDFGLGFFRAQTGDAIVSAELKNPRADLDAPQTGNYDGASPVQQAFRAAAGSVAKWIIVSNFEELRLYSVASATNYERVVFSDVLSRADFCRAYALFGRPALLGREGRASPLEKLLEGTYPMLVDPAPGRVRLVQQVTFDAGELGLHQLEDGLHNALANTDDGLDVWPKVDPKSHAALIGDRLVIEGNRDACACVIEAARDGVLRISEQLPVSDPTTKSVDNERKQGTFAERELAYRIARFGLFIENYFDVTLKIGRPSKVGFYAELIDIAGATCVPSDDASPFKASADLSAARAVRSGVDYHPPTNGLFDRRGIAVHILRELVFPFEAGQPPKKTRLRRTANEFEGLVDSYQVSAWLARDRRT